MAEAVQINFAFRRQSASSSIDMSMPSARIIAEISAVNCDALTVMQFESVILFQ